MKRISVAAARSGADRNSGPGPWTTRRGGGQDKAADTKPKVDEKAYKAALDRIPEPKEKYDPWGITKPAPSRPRSRNRFALARPRALRQVRPFSRL